MIVRTASKFIEDFDPSFLRAASRLGAGKCAVCRGPKGRKERRGWCVWGAEVQVVGGSARDLVPDHVIVPYAPAYVH